MKEASIFTKSEYPVHTNMKEDAQSTPSSSYATNMADTEIAKAVNEIGFWWHSLDLHGFITPGGKSQQVLHNEWRAMDVPDLRGKSVLDIGAWDGFFSFEAERHGAESVVALDHYVWATDRPGLAKYRQECMRVAREPDPVETTKFWNPVDLPGKNGFDLAHRILDSKVTTRNQDFLLASSSEIGTFDVVFFLGVLYHMQNPLESLKKVAELTRTLAIIETHAVEILGQVQSLAEFYPASELNGDPSNWWGPNIAALVGLCKAAGFSRVVVKKGPPKLGPIKSMARHIAATLGIPWGTRARHYRAIVHAWK